MTSRKKQDERFLAWLALIGICVFAIWLIPAIRWLFIILAIVIVSVFILKYVNRMKKYQRGDVYSMEHQCPNCGRMNTFHYPTGNPTGGVTVTCHYCHRLYKR
jgi:membrane protein implicated in regulation of membrane protease activity